MDYFEGCSRKQNIIDYTSVRMATATEARAFCLMA